MPLLEDMPPIHIGSEALAPWAEKWLISRAFNKKEGMDFGSVFDAEVGKALAAMLGKVEIIVPNQNELMPKKCNAVEVGPVRVVGGIRPQNYDVGYRPDGVRFVFDSKTLNDVGSVGKNFQNMVNDLGTEATTVHVRFPYAVVAFMVVIPTPCFAGATRIRFTRVLERLVGRDSPIGEAHKAEALSLVLWKPEEAAIDPDWPERDSPLRIERFSTLVQTQYKVRYDGMPPHHQASRDQREALDENEEYEEENDD